MTYEYCGGSGCYNSTKNGRIFCGVCFRKTAKGEAFPDRSNMKMPDWVKDFINRSETVKLLKPVKAEVSL